MEVFLLTVQFGENYVYHNNIMILIPNINGNNLVDLKIDNPIFQW